MSELGYVFVIAMSDSMKVVISVIVMEALLLHGQDSNQEHDTAENIRLFLTW